MNENDKKTCRQCQHFFITFDATTPYGCRAFKFKSKELPSRAVVQNSGSDCHAFTSKKQGPDKASTGNDSY